MAPCHHGRLGFPFAAYAQLLHQNEISTLKDPARRVQLCLRQIYQRVSQYITPRLKCMTQHSRNAHCTGCAVNCRQFTVSVTWLCSKHWRPRVYSRAAAGKDGSVETCLPMFLTHPTGGALSRTFDEKTWPVLCQHFSTHNSTYVVHIALALLAPFDLRRAAA